MRSRRSSTPLNNARRSVGVVVVALIALIAQLMTPGSSLAAQAAMAVAPMACADMPDMAGMADMAGMRHEAKAPAADKGGKGFGGLPCQDCLVPATAALPPSLATPVPISYATSYIRRVTFVQYRVPPTRAPPRPPGQGPPTSDV